MRRGPLLVRPTPTGTTRMTPPHGLRQGNVARAPVRRVDRAHVRAAVHASAHDLFQRRLRAEVCRQSGRHEDRSAIPCTRGQAHHEAPLLTVRCGRRAHRQERTCRVCRVFSSTVSAGHWKARRMRCASSGPPWWSPRSPGERIPDFSSQRRLRSAPSPAPGAGTLQPGRGWSGRRKGTRDVQKLDGWGVVRHCACLDFVDTDGGPSLAHLRVCVNRADI
jgi:hypothetical protein